MYQRFREIFHDPSTERKKRDESNELKYSTLFWLLRDFPDANVFAQKLRIVPNQLMRRLEAIAESEITNEFTANIALAICRIEKSADINDWAENIKHFLKKFIFYQVGFLILKMNWIRLP